MKLAIQGNPGSYHEQAAWQYIERNNVACADLLYQPTFSGTFASLRDGECDGAVVAIANNAVGFIHEPYKELVRDGGKTFCVAGETYVRIRHQLLGLPGAKLSDITHVHSQAPALGQCEEFLQSRLPRAHREEEQDTALSAQLVSKHGKKSHAAIASRQAGELHGLVPIAEDIQDDTDNITRFLHIVRATGSTGIYGANKLTALLTTPEHPGSLAAALSLFGERMIGISSLQSLYVPNTPFRMQFWVDVDAGGQDSRVIDIGDELGKLGCEFVVLGSYTSEKVPLAA